MNFNDYKMEDQEPTYQELLLQDILTVVRGMESDVSDIHSIKMELVDIHTKLDNQEKLLLAILNRLETDKTLKR